MLMMEHRRGGVERYITSLPAYDGESGAVVCHANPFTRGHRHLVEYAAARCPHLSVFVLSEETMGCCLYPCFRLFRVMAKIAPETSDTMTMGRTVPLPVVGEASPLVKRWAVSRT